TESASIVGLSVVGALVATVVKISMPVKFAVGKVTLNLQTGIFDKIMPALLPALLTLLIYHLLGNKKWTPTKIILLVIAISLVGTFLGIFKA
ncbi:PTS fructose transporter subunit IID, partial [Lactiplantibacillus plantarum]